MIVYERGQIVSFDPFALITPMYRYAPWNEAMMKKDQQYQPVVATQEDP